MMEKVALVTGASSGIGEATARKLASLGYTVYAAARRVDRMAALADEGIRPVSLDVTDDASMSSVVDAIIGETGRIDVLVNNAGYGSYGALEDVPLSEARRQIEVNVFGLARMTQLVLPHMRKQGSGYVVNVSSMGGKIYEPLGSWYHAAKFAVEGLSDSLRLELRPFGIAVVIIEPGAIKTEWGAIAADSVLSMSGSGVYAGQARAVARVFGQSVNNPKLASDPSVIADVIAKAVTSARPKTRYVAGRGARQLLLARRLLTDRGFDRMLGIAYRPRRADR
jgi:NAD(P)-dependent dehydrogenase (short-subunit alcohol dehydrogenase family)